MSTAERTGHGWRFPAQPQLSGLLSAKDLDAVLRVLADCERVPDPTQFRMTALESIARHLGYRNTTFFMGSTLRQVFADRAPAANGFAAKLVGQYVAEHWESDIFSQVESIALLRQRPMITLQQLRPPQCERVRRYVDKFMLRNGIRSKAVVRLSTGNEYYALMGLIEPAEQAFGPRAHAIGALLGTHLGALLRLHSVRPAASGLVGLSARQADVVELVALGHGNEEIGRELNISIGTVKKHLTAALHVTGCANRTQLALAWRRRNE